MEVATIKTSLKQHQKVQTNIFKGLVVEQRALSMQISGSEHRENGYQKLPRKC
jgi:hypothetical protein